VNPTTGASMVVGNTGTVLLDIAFAPTGDLYGITASELYRINPSTAAATRIGFLSTDEPPANQFANALTFGSNGTLYAASFVTTAIYTVDLLTGRASSIGTTGFASSGDLAFSNGSLFLSATGGGPSGDLLVKIDLRALSQSSIVGNMGIRGVYGLAATSDGALYGVAGNQVFALDTSTGATTRRATFFTSGSAFGATANPTPEPTSAFLLSTGLVWVCRRRWTLRGQRSTIRPARAPR